MRVGWLLIAALAPGCGDDVVVADGGACQKDTDCKGARICRQGICVDPTADMAVAPGADLTMVDQAGADLAGADMAVAASCTNLKKDGDETDIDCGGSCSPCADGKACLGAADCTSGECLNNQCVPKQMGGPKLPVFGAPVAYGADKSPAGVAAADLNGDGKLDLLVANEGSGVSVLLGKGDGTFGAASNYGAGLAPYVIYTVDVDADGHLDALVESDPTVSMAGFSVLLGKGDGTLGAPTSYPIIAERTTVPALGDFNGDGRLDYAVAGAWGCQNVCQGWLNVYTATANGAFQQKQSNKLLGVAPKAAATGDFDGDGKLDLVIVDVIAAQVSVLTGAGDGTFGAPAGGFAVPVYTGYVIASADWNGDGKPDVATSGPELALALGKGGGAFGTVALYSDGSSYGCLFTSDINSDGKPDLIAGGGPSFTLLLGAGDGTFPISVSYIGGIGSSGIAVDDFNGDGKRDVAVADSQVVNVLINQTP